MARLPTDDWYYGGAQAARGPVSQSVLRALRGRGEIGDGTAVWNAAHAAGAWLPYAEVFGRVSSAGAGASDDVASSPEPMPGSRRSPLLQGDEREPVPHGEPLRHERAEATPPPLPPPPPRAAPGPTRAVDPSAGRNPASFLRRFAALFLDGLIIGIPLQIAFFIVAFAAGYDPTREDAEIPIYGLLLVAWGAYFVFMEGKFGATLGKRLLDIMVVDTRGAPIDVGRALARHLAAALNYVTLYLGYLLAALTPRRQGLHDLLAGTVVVYRVPGQVSSTGGCAVAIVAVFGGLFVLGIVAAIAIPAYVDYSTRTRVLEGLRAIEPLKQQLAAHWLESGELYDSVDEIPDFDPPSASGVRDIDIANGTIVLTFRTGFDDDQTLALEPVRTGETITWLCGQQPAPANARRITNVRAAGRTTLDARVLPTACRR